MRTDVEYFDINNFDGVIIAEDADSGRFRIEQKRNRWKHMRSEEYNRKIVFHNDEIEPLRPVISIPEKIAVIEKKKTTSGTIRNYDPTKAKWLDFDKHKSIAPPSFHERLMSIFESELKQYI